MTTTELQKGIIELLSSITKKSGSAQLSAMRSSLQGIEFSLNNSGEFYSSLDDALYALTEDGIKANKIKKIVRLEDEAAKLRMEVNG